MEKKKARKRARKSANFSFRSQWVIVADQEQLANGEFKFTITSEILRGHTFKAINRKEFSKMVRRALLVLSHEMPRTELGKKLLGK